MSVLLGLGLASTAFQMMGQLESLQNQKELAKFNIRESKIQAKTSRDLFNITFPNLVKQQVSNRGMQATQIAKRGVAVGQGSALSFLSEQARMDGLNQTLSKFQHDLEQRSFKVEQLLGKRTVKQLKSEKLFTLLGGATQAGGIVATGGQ